MEPLRSAKSTVTCLRSPSRALLEMRIFSARCAGVLLSGEVNREALGRLLPLSIWISAWPHFRQNFAPGRLSSPHAVHAASRRAPHSSQNAAPTGFSRWHLGQVIRVFDLRRDLRSDGCGHRSPLGASGQAAVTREACTMPMSKMSLKKAYKRPPRARGSAAGNSGSKGNVFRHPRVRRSLAWPSRHVLLHGPHELLHHLLANVHLPVMPQAGSLGHTQ